jgi:biopolymer transport protein ExbD
MSHGGGGGEGQSAEPNLTPLLDLVLQLVMFFMLVANFIMDEMSDKVKLPSASQAKPLSTKDTNFAYINVDRGGRILTSGDRPPMVDPSEIETYLRNNIARIHPKGENFAYENLTVIVRADRESAFRDVFKVIRSVKAAGFKNLQLRAEISAK